MKVSKAKPVGMKAKKKGESKEEVKKELTPEEKEELKKTEQETKVSVEKKICLVCKKLVRRTAALALTL